MYQTVDSSIYTNHCLYSGGNDVYPDRQSYELNTYQPPGQPYPLSDLPRLDQIRHLEIKCCTGSDQYKLLNALLDVAFGCLLRTLRLELWCGWTPDELAEPLDALMKLEVSDMISITVLVGGPEYSDLTINILDEMLANAGQGWIYDVGSANLDTQSNRKYPFLPKNGSQVAEWILVPKRERANGTLKHLPEKGVATVLRPRDNAICRTLFHGKHCIIRNAEK